jgi:hypothetical protein
LEDANVRISKTAGHSAKWDVEGEVGSHHCNLAVQLVLHVSRRLDLQRWAAQSRDTILPNLCPMPSKEPDDEDKYLAAECD